MKRTVLIVALSILMLGASCVRHVHSTIETGTIALTVIDRNTREPLIGATVAVNGAKLRHLTDIEGRVLIHHATVGLDTIAVTSIGYIQAETTLVVNPEKTSVCIMRVVQEAVAQRENREIADGRKSGLLVGRVYDSTTLKPIQGAKVKSGRFSAETNEAGRYQLHVDFLGTYDLEFKHKKYQALRVGYVWIGPDSSFLDVYLKSKSPPYGFISGKVWDMHFNEPLVAVSVSVVGTTLGAMTDQHGEYRITKLKPGTYAIKFTVIGYDSKQVDKVEVVTNQNTVVDCNMEQTPTDKTL